MGFNHLLYNMLTAFIKENLAVMVLLTPVIVGFIAWKLAQWKTKVDLGVLQIPTLDEKIDALAKKIEEILGYLRGKTGDNVLQSSSPLTLNTKGEKIAEETHLAGLAKFYAKQFELPITNENAYQIQERCFHYARTALLPHLQEHHPDWFTFLTGYAYQKGMQAETILSVFGLLLRDEVLALTNRSSGDIDLHAPSSPEP